MIGKSLMSSNDNKGLSTIQQIRYGSIFSYLSIGINICLGIIYTPWILHEVGSSHYGLYTLVDSFIVMFLMDFGMNAAVTRFISYYKARGDKDAVNTFVGISIKFYCMVCSIATIILLIVYCNIEQIYTNLTTEEMAVLKVLFLITSFFLVTCFPMNLCNGILYAYEKLAWIKGTDILNKIAIVVFTVIALLNHGGIYALVLIKGIVNFATFILRIFIVCKYTSVRASFKNASKVSMKDIFSFSAWSTVNGLSFHLIFNIIPSILAAIANTTAITLFGFANVIEGYVSIITSAINGVFMPKVSRIVVNKKDASDVLPLMVKVGRINQSVVSILIIGITVLGKDFVQLWVGSEYADLYYCILFLSFPYFISASQQIGNTCITVFNKVKYSAILGVIVGGLNVLFCIILCPVYGVVGVCAGTGMVFLIRIVGLNYIYKRMLNINILKFFKECHFYMMPGIMISFLLSFGLNQIWTNSYSGLFGWGIFAAKAVAIICIFISCMWLIGWNTYEKELIRSFFKKN